MLEISREPRISLNDLARREGVHISTCWRWCLRGVKGHILESINVGGKKFTTLPAFERWMAKINGTGSLANQSQQRRGDSVDAAERELDAILRN
jgi:hypothetical protein